MSLNLVANKPFRYPSGSHGRDLKKGDAFAALSESDARALVTVGTASYEPPRLQAQQGTTKSLLPEDASQEGARGRGRRAQRYRRTDMRAEG